MSTKNSKIMKTQVIKLDADMVKKAQEASRFLKPIGPPLNATDVVRTCLDFAVEALPYFMPLASKIGTSKIGFRVEEPLKIALTRIIASGIDDATKKTDEEIAKSRGEKQAQFK